MCCLDSKYNRKKCVFKKRPIFPHSLLHYKVDIFSFLSLSLISDYSASVRFLINRSLSPQIHFLSHYKVDTFLFLTVVLIIYYSASERFLIIGLVGLVIFFYPYPLRGKFIFLKNYRSNIFIFIVIQRFLRIGLVIRQKFSLSLSIKGQK